MVLGDKHISIVSWFRIVSEVGYLTIHECHARSPNWCPNVDSHMEKALTMENLSIVHPRSELVIFANAEDGLRGGPLSCRKIQHRVFFRKYYDFTEPVPPPVNHDLPKRSLAMTPPHPRPFLLDSSDHSFLVDPSLSSHLTPSVSQFA